MQEDTQELNLDSPEELTNEIEKIKLDETQITELLAKAQEFKQKGNDFYINKEYEQAISQYSESILIMVDCYEEKKDECSVYFNNRAACYFAIEKYENVIEDTTKSIELVPSWKAHLRRAKSRQKINKNSDALADYDKAISLGCTEPGIQETRNKLQVEVKIQQEKDKEEMIGNLKDLGNKFLSNFGLSTDNFNFQQDPNTGGYNVSMQQ